MRTRRSIEKKACDLRSDCWREADGQFFGALFEREWEVFVIREDPATGGFKGQTICCDAALPVMPGGISAAACC